MGKGGLVCCALAALALVLAGIARGDDWWPHPAAATWTYEWTDSVYKPTPTRERVSVKEQSGDSWVLSWTTRDAGNPAGSLSSVGEMSFQETAGGIVNTNWASNPPPPDFPILCPQAIGCNNSLAASLYHLIWGSRSPLLAAPLLQGVQWQGVGGAQSDVSSNSTYLGTEMVKVPAFPSGVLAAKVRTDVTQVGAIGDPYGSGVRTVWWVFGVGPVKIVIHHAGGSTAPVTTSELRETNLVPGTAPADANYFPLRKGLKLRYRFKNSKHVRRPSVQEVVVEDALNSSARFTVRHVSGPIKVSGSYGFATRNDGVTNLWGLTRAATALKLPPLGPRALPKTKRRHFFTPFDLMTFGFNPVLPAYPAPGQTWGSKKPSRDFSMFGVNGSARVLGSQRVKVPAGAFDALVVRASLRQPGFRFGSGTRTSYFAAGKGLVKLVFRHGDGSVSTVELLR